MGEVTSAERRADGSKILLVEDEAALRRATARILTAAGHTVVEAENGRVAAAAARAQAFDAIVSDIAMPDMDGIALLRSVREHDLDVPVVLVTGLPEVSTAADAVAYGAFRYLTKPVEAAVLRDVVRKAVDMHRMAKIKREAFALLGREGARDGDRAGLEVRFEEALRTLWMAYQPIVRAETRTLFGYEALLRSASVGLPHPGAVLEAAEKLGRLGDLGRRIRRASTESFAGAADDARLFVNLHTEDLSDEELFSTSSPLCTIASRVVLEVTERASLDSVRDARERVARLRALGFQIAIDDLGAGYAGLTSFAQLEPEVVKLDMTLVRGVNESPMKKKLIRSITELCRGMGMLVVGEGVETPAERDVLVELGCDLLQGYLFAKPGKAFPAWSWGPAS